jgi:hypothetical protein
MHHTWVKRNPHCLKTADKQVDDIKTDVSTGKKKAARRLHLRCKIKRQPDRYNCGVVQETDK